MKCWVYPTTKSTVHLVSGPESLSHVCNFAHTSNTDTMHRIDCLEINIFEDKSLSQKTECV